MGWLLISLGAVGRDIIAVVRIKWGGREGRMEVI